MSRVTYQAGESLPKQIGRYRILARLGHGGMGTVYEATDTHLNRRVAVKVPRDGLPDEDLHRRFKREALAAARLNHPNVCSVHDIGVHEGRPYLVMAFVAGQSLTEWIARHQPIPIGQAVDRVVRLAEILAAAHAEGVIHRDVKPDNIILTPRDELVLVDFGLALLGGQELTRLTNAGKPLGTPMYMSPEQVSGNIEEMDKRCDVYSLGVILYEMLAGQRPFQGNNCIEVYHQIIYRQPTILPLRTLRPEIPTGLEAVCQRAFARHSRERFDTMAAFADALRPFASERIEGTTPGRGLLGWLFAGRGSKSPSTVPAAVLTTTGQLRTPSPNAPVLAEHRAVQDEVVQLRRELADVQPLREQYDKLREWLSRVPCSRTFHQPVLVVGPRGVGKTSLVRQWQAPWDSAQTAGTVRHRVSELPLLKFDETDPVPHDLFPDVTVRRHIRLSLRVHDFPGEIDAQEMILRRVKTEMKDLRKGSKKRLGVVLICMFDAAQAATGLRAEMMEYYNGTLFRDLRRLVATNNDFTGVERLILVFNKADLLREHCPPGASERELLARCAEGYADVLAPLRGVVNRERVCEVLAVLGREGLMRQGTGSNFIKGEAARGIVQAFGVADQAGVGDSPEPVGDNFGF